jgi:DNA-binding CsgD family transcriptional regulator
MRVVVGCAAVPDLTPRQLQVIAWLAAGLGLKQAARRMGISLGTAACHLMTAKRRLGIATTAEVLVLAGRMGWCAGEG